MVARERLGGRRERAGARQARWQADRRGRAEVGGVALVIPVYRDAEIIGAFLRAARTTLRRRT
jgi:hypothetical protein